MKLISPGSLSSKWFPFALLFAISLNSTILLVPSCKSSPDRSSGNKNVTPKEDLIKNHQSMMRDESTEINSYVERHKLNVVTTQTGLRYYIYKKGTGTTLVANDDYVSLNYNVSLLDGSQVYSSDSTGALDFQVGKSEIASGLQEGIKFMKLGDKAIFIVPSHLAYGLSGDGDKIKLYEAIVIDAELIKVSHP